MKEGMKMPGFTAEASLYKPRRHYDLGVSLSADGQAVIPQRDIDGVYHDYHNCGYGCFWSSKYGHCLCYFGLLD